MLLVLISVRCSTKRERNSSGKRLHKRAKSTSGLRYQVQVDLNVEGTNVKIASTSAKRVRTFYKSNKAALLLLPMRLDELGQLIVSFSLQGMDNYELWNLVTEIFPCVLKDFFRELELERYQKLRFDSEYVYCSEGCNITRDGPMAAAQHFYTEYLLRNKREILSPLVRVPVKLKRIAIVSGDVSENQRIEVEEEVRATISSMTSGGYIQSEREMGRGIRRARGGVHCNTVLVFDLGNEEDIQKNLGAIQDAIGDERKLSEVMEEIREEVKSRLASCCGGELVQKPEACLLKMYVRERGTPTAGGDKALVLLALEFRIAGGGCSAPCHGGKHVESIARALKSCRDPKDSIVQKLLELNDYLAVSSHNSRLYLRWRKSDKTHRGKSFDPIHDYFSGKKDEDLVSAAHRESVAGPSTGNMEEATKPTGVGGTPNPSPLQDKELLEICLPLTPERIEMVREITEWKGLDLDEMLKCLGSRDEPETQSSTHEEFPIFSEEMSGGMAPQVTRGLEDTDYYSRVADLAFDDSLFGGSLIPQPDLLS
jgi:hypothetical protein